MSLFDYEQSRTIDPGVPFYGLLMALMRRADTDNLATLVGAFPEVYHELDGRYNAPGGCLSVEEYVNRFGEEPPDYIRERLQAPAGTRRVKAHDPEQAGPSEEGEGRG